MYVFDMFTGTKASKSWELAAEAYPFDIDIIRIFSKQEDNVPRVNFPATGVTIMAMNYILNVLTLCVQ